MTRDPFPGRVTISRSSNNVVRIAVRDAVSGNEFVEVELTLEQYALVATGMGHVECALRVRSLEHVGKVRIVEQRSVVCPFPRYTRAEAEEWLLATQQEEDWRIDIGPLRSQRGMTLRDGVLTLHYTVIRYVDRDQAIPVE